MKNYITALRFPLAVCVVMIHAYGSAWAKASTDSFTPADWIGTLFSRVLPSFAVPLFFVISGYLFFLNTDDFTLHTYRKKLSRRVRSLLVPYLLWILIALAVYALQSVHGHLSWARFAAAFAKEWAKHGGWDALWGCNPLGGGFRHFLGFYVEATAAPALTPLWFVRDLMLVSLLTPVLRLLFRRLGAWGLLLPGLLHYAHLWPNLGGVSAEGLWFFSLGAWMSVKAVDPVAATRRVLPHAALLAAPAAVCLLAFDGGFLHGFLFAVWHYSAMTLAVQAAAACCKSRAPSLWLSDSAFFIYASHIIVLSPVSRYMHALTLHSPWYWQTAGYFAAPAAALTACLLVYRLLSTSSHFWPLGVKERL